MLSKSEIKLIRSLSQKKFRDEEGLFVAEGEKLVEEAVKSDFEIVKIYRSDEIGEEAMSRITLLNSPSPILALLKKPDTPKNSEINRLVAPKMLAIGLDGIRDPGNAGTIIRIADWFGIDSIFASEDTVDIFNPKVVQSTMGAIFRIKFIYCDLQNIARTFVSQKMPIYGTFLEGEVIYDTEL
ncbi:MAG: TrmH family RNA methyltransferase, partial [Bacteroidales bacterium]|nr:TrmH family RNA methyltransferase [Bacteroidales bacterium]